MKECLEFLTCEAVFLSLSNLTGLALHEQCDNHSDSDADDEVKTQPSESTNSEEAAVGGDRHNPETKRRKLSSGVAELDLPKAEGDDKADEPKGLLNLCETNYKMIWFMNPFLDKR